MSKKVEIRFTLFTASNAFKFSHVTTELEQDTVAEKERFLDENLKLWLKAGTVKFKDLQGKHIYLIGTSIIGFGEVK